MPQIRGWKRVMNYKKSIEYRNINDSMMRVYVYQKKEWYNEGLWGVTTLGIHSENKKFKTKKGALGYATRWMKTHYRIIHYKNGTRYSNEKYPTEYYKERRRKY